MSKRIGGIKGCTYIISSWHLNGVPRWKKHWVNSSIMSGRSPPLYLLLLFLTFSALVANPKKTILHGGQSRSWSAEQGKKEKEKVWQRPPPLPPSPPPPARCSFGGKKQKIKIKKSRDASTIIGATQVGVTQVVSVRLASVKDSYDSSARPMGVASQNSTLPCAIATVVHLFTLIAMQGHQKNVKTKQDNVVHHHTW